MVLRINEKEANPNPHINFTTALQSRRNHTEARELLRSLAAQVRPMMKSEGLKVNSFEEYEFNQVFAGRNWNAGDLQGRRTRLAQTQRSILSLPFLAVRRECIEVFSAHNYASVMFSVTNLRVPQSASPMSTQPAFTQAQYNEELRAQATALRQKGYFGDGYWSSGTRLADNATVQGETALVAGDFADYICGGAQSRSKSSLWKPKKRKKPMTRKGMTLGAGNRVDGASLDLEKGQDPNSTFRKRATSKNARQMRLEATEKRLAALPKQEEEESGSTTEDEEDYVESDSDRRRLMGDIKVEETGSAWDAFLAQDIKPFDTKQSTLDDKVERKPNVKAESSSSQSRSEHTTTQRRISPAKTEKQPKEVIEID
ncbi:hypothetical protein E3P99_01044 [Wallemia hederae]|uniref:WLM domain-containing protein n=1 Tax=Wallemia hederae TaxID=1540922 RepID=A0A4T0FSR6_9BASI|nr:hypothetical protein E3P99_01044 [Wallemia hederae]